MALCFDLASFLSFYLHEFWVHSNILLPILLKFIMWLLLFLRKIKGKRCCVKCHPITFAGYWDRAGNWNCLEHNWGDWSDLVWGRYLSLCLSISVSVTHNLKCPLPLLLITLLLLLLLLAYIFPLLLWNLYHLGLGASWYSM